MSDLAATPVEALVARVQELTERVEAFTDPDARATTDELVAAVLQLYGEGLTRIFAALDGEDPALAGVREALTRDGVVASLMVMHDLYPDSLEDRVRAALDEVRPYLASHEGDVEPEGIALEPTGAEGEPDRAERDDIGGIDAVGQGGASPEPRTGPADGDEEAEGEEEMGDFNHAAVCGIGGH